MTPEDLHQIKAHSETTYDNFEVIKSTTSTQEVEAYQDMIDESLVGVEQWEQWADEELNKWKTEKGKAKLEKKRLQSRQEQAKRLYWSLKNNRVISPH